MKTVLVIDQGNTLAKTSVFRDDVYICSEAFPKGDVEALMPILETFAPEAAIYSSVAKVDSAFVESVRKLLGGNLLLFSHNTPVPIKIDYRTPATLGLDRVAAAVAAAEIAPRQNVVVADAGTALTIDAVADSVFRGGNISPGISMRLKALAEFTARLPRVAPDGELPLFGRDTDSAIRCGAVRGAAAEVAQAARGFFAPNECHKIIITGGDACFLADALPDASVFDSSVVPDLVARGLYRIYLHNENIS